MKSAWNMVALCVSGGVGAVSIGASVRSDLDTAFREQITARYAAMARGDSATVHRQLADGMVWVVGASGSAVTTPQFLAAIARVQTPPPRYQIDSVHAHQWGSAITVSYRRTESRRVGAYEATNVTRALEVFVRHGDRWLLTDHSHTWVVRPVTAVALDSATLDAFVGRYEIGPGYIDSVHREGEAAERGGRPLVATATGQSEGAVLVPVSATAFSPDGIGPLIVFERDSTGRVVDYVQGLPDGQIVRARRLP